MREKHAVTPNVQLAIPGFSLPIPTSPAESENITCGS
jgi:hypothetical protein